MLASIEIVRAFDGLPPMRLMSIPTAVTIGVDGAEDVPEARIAGLAREVVAGRSRADTFGPDDSSGINAAPRGDA